MTINLSVPCNPAPELRPKIVVIGVGGAGGNAVNNMIRSQLEGVDFVVANTDSQALAQSRAERRIQLGVTVTQGLGAGSRPDIGRIAAEEALEEIIEELKGSNMAFIAAGLGGGTGTGAAPVIARAAREQGILTVGVVTKPFHFEGAHRMRIADAGMEELEQYVDTLLIIPNQNLFRVANERTTFADAFKMADDVLYSGVRGVTDLMVMPGLINLDFADIRAVMSEMGKAMMGTGEATGERRALDAAEAAISNPLLDDVSMKGARGVLINITGGPDMTLFEVDEAANRVRSEVDPDAFIIFGSTFDDTLEGRMRVSVVATGMEAIAADRTAPAKVNRISLVGEQRIAKPAGQPSREAAALGFTAAEVPANPLFAEAGTGAETDLHAASEAAPSMAFGGISAGGETETAVAGDAFIPPAPQQRAAPEIRRLADPVMGEGGSKARPADDEATGVSGKIANLFNRMTGSSKPARPSRPEARVEPEVRPAPQSAKQSRLGGMTPEERLPASQPEEDLLDIPAFLRRQAN